MKVHADVLRMAKTEEKRDRIKWYHARRIFFDRCCFAEGLELAKESNHPDARFLVSLFPDGGPTTEENAKQTFVAHGDDARCICWAAVCGGGSELLQRAAEAGNAWAQFLYYLAVKGPWLDLAVAQCEPKAMTKLADRLWVEREYNDETEMALAFLLWREAAELGDGTAQFKYACFCCPDSLERFKWIRRAVTQPGHIGLRDLLWWAIEQVSMFEKSGSGRIVFEVGAAFASIECWKDIGRSSAEVVACSRAMQLYKQWCFEANVAVLCWLSLARSNGVAKDIRLLIADLIWDERAAWSERTAT